MINERMGDNIITSSRVIIIMFNVSNEKSMTITHEIVTRINAMLKR